MRDSKDLKKLKLHDLFADLKVYEFELWIRTEGEPFNSQPTKASVATTSTPIANKATSSRKAVDQINDNQCPYLLKTLANV